MTGLENLHAKTMLADKDGDFWYYDGVGGMYCMVEGGVAEGALSQRTIEFAAKWAPFTQLMAADWGNALTVALDERDAAERELIDCRKELASAYDVLSRLNSDIERCARCGIEGVAGSVALFDEVKKLLEAREIARKAPLRCAPGDGLTPADPSVAAVCAVTAEQDRTALTARVKSATDLLAKVKRGDYAWPNGVAWAVDEVYRRLTGDAPVKPGDGLTPVDPAADAQLDATPLLASELIPGSRFKDRFGDTWSYEHGNLYRIVVGGIDQLGPLTAVDPNGRVIQRYKPLIRIAPPNEQGNGLTLPDSNTRTVVTTEPQTEPKDGDLFKDNAGDTWIVNSGLYHLVTYNGRRPGAAGLVVNEEEIEKYKPLIKLVPENKT